MAAASAGRADHRAVGDHRGPGRAVRQGGAEVDLLQRLAGRRRHEHRAAHVSRPELVSGRQRSSPRAPHQQRVAARGPDPPHAGRRLHRLARADRGRRRSRFRGAAERLRADAQHDRRGDGGRALRGPARLAQEVRPPGRQGAGADERVRHQARGGAPRRRRGGRGHRPRRAHRRPGGHDPRQRHRSLRPPLHHRRAHPRRLHPREAGDRRGDCAGARVRAVRRHALVRDVEARSPGSRAVRRGDPREVPEQAARVQLLAVLQLAQAPERRAAGHVPARARRDGLQVPVRHALRLPRPEPQHVRAGQGV